jgi:hypothetical protein
MNIEIWYVYTNDMLIIIYKMYVYVYCTSYKDPEMIPPLLIGASRTVSTIAVFTIPNISVMHKPSLFWSYEYAYPAVKTFPVQMAIQRMALQTTTRQESQRKEM